MPPRLTPASIRELVHLLFLEELAGVRRGGGVIVKGGVNLRLFFGSPRYSEDMDLDGTMDGSTDVRSRITGLFDDRDFTRRLHSFGIEARPGTGTEQGHRDDVSVQVRSDRERRGPVSHQSRGLLPESVLLAFLAENVPVEALKEAYDRALGISYDEYRGQVLEFLEESELAMRGTEDAWDEKRLRVAGLIEAILALAGRA